MKKINDFENVQASTGEFSRPTAGGYCVELINIVDVPLDAKTGKGDYLKINYDICAGEFAGYYSKQHERFGGDWFASFIRSYKDSAAGMFKHFINCVEDSNVGYKWNWDEQSLTYKQVGVVLGEEEYFKKDGTVGVKLVVKEIKTIEQIKNNDFKIPAIKKLVKDELQSAGFVPVQPDDEVPF